LDKQKMKEKDELLVRHNLSHFHSSLDNLR
jgi:hypothetical protein